MIYTFENTKKFVLILLAILGEFSEILEIERYYSNLDSNIVALITGSIVWVLIFPLKNEKVLLHFLKSQTCSSV